MEIPRQEGTTDYYQVLPQPPQPESTTTVTQGTTVYHIVEGMATGANPEAPTTYPKRTPQKHRQYWAVFWAVIERGGMIRTKGGLLKLKDEIEEWVG